MSLASISRQTAALDLSSQPQPQPQPLHPTSSLPIPTFTLNKSLNGIQTDLLIQEYDDRVFIMITQLGKMGFLTQATLSPLLPLLNPPTTPQPTPTPNTHLSNLTSILPFLPPPHPSILLTPLLGTPRNPTDQTRDELYISQVATLVWWFAEQARSGQEGRIGGRKSVVVSLALAKDDTDLDDQANPDADAEDDEDDDDGPTPASSERERERFAGVMGMIAEWSGQ